jgi:hypothetical protein
MSAALETLTGPTIVLYVVNRPQNFGRLGYYHFVEMCRQLMKIHYRVAGCVHLVALPIVC